MWIAKNWKDYQVIDCSQGEKLERWGKYLLVRPDPQVIWDTPKNDRGWKHPNGQYRKEISHIYPGDPDDQCSQGKSGTLSGNSASCCEKSGRSDQIKSRIFCC